VLVRVAEGGGAAVERNPSGLPIPAFRPRFTSDQEARTLAAYAAERAASAGIVTSAGALPASADLSSLDPARARAGALPAVFSVDTSGPVEIDLVRDGPHAVIGGMTGSGKSELLVSWVVALAKAASPAEVNFLLVDFKGGSAFAAVSRLRHTVGLITDLDQLAAERALSSLRAELRHRERVLAAAGARAIDELSGARRMPRLVIVVDEFAVVASEFPELQTLFADLASRGRSLGIHLILCTQRPAGVVRDSVLANCSLRLSLRVNNGADSVAVVGTPGAAELAAHPAGRCLISIGGAPAVALQVALTTLDDVTELAGRFRADSHPVRRPWCEPLPAVVPLDVVIAGCSGPGLPFGLLDVPEEQSQPPAVYEPASDGNLMVIGAIGTGKSGTLATLQEAGRMRSITTVRIPSDVEGAWDTVVAAVTELGTEKGRNVLYLLDDFDALIGRFGQDHRLEFTDLLVRLMREGGRTVLTAGRVTSSIQSVLAQCDSRLILRMQNRQEHVLAGADSALYSSELLPGAGTWRGHRVQVAAASPEGQMSPTGLVRRRSQWPLHAQGFSLVAPSAAATAARILAPDKQAITPGIVPSILTLPVPTDQALTVTAESSPDPQVLAGSPADWQAQWGLFAAARSSGPVVFVGCSVAEFRALAGTRQLPPPLGSAPGAAWILERDGCVIRAQLP
jgi:S-DNA-T family DNA segregation ATPase FtsK/SpoIIIE